MRKEFGTEGKDAEKVITANPKSQGNEGSSFTRQRLESLITERWVLICHLII